MCSGGIERCLGLGGSGVGVGVVGTVLLAAVLVAAFLVLVALLAGLLRGVCLAAHGESGGGEAV